MNLATAQDLPQLELRSGPVRVRVADVSTPRPELGGRFVHGGYVLGLDWDGDERLTSPYVAWDPLQGVGLPEVFEWPLGWAHSKRGDRLLRPGCGVLERTADDPYDFSLPLVEAAPWTQRVRDARVVQFTSECAQRVGAVDYRYAIEREVEALPDGVVIRTELMLQCGWNHPVMWFAHPYFRRRQSTVALAHPGGLWKTNAEEGFESIAGLAGRTGGTALTLLEGSRKVELSATLPLDHLILYWTKQAFSPEPQWVHTWKDGERLSWELRYTFDP